MTRICTDGWGRISFLTYFWFSRVEHKEHKDSSERKVPRKNPPHFIKCGGNVDPQFMKSGCGRGSFYIHISWKVNVGWRVRFATETFVPFFMKSGTKKCRGEEALVWPCRACRAWERWEILTTDYTDLHGWMRSDFFLMYFLFSRVEHKEHKDSFWGWGVCIHISWKVNVGYVLLGLVMVRPIFHEKWDEKVPRWGGFGLTV